MSGFAFSHQFSHRWHATPPPVKQTIIQELDDIVMLLQPETDLDSYRFSVPNLHDKVEQLMAIEAIRQEKLLAEERKREREEQERLEQQRIAQEKLEQRRLEQQRLEQQRLEQQKINEQARLAAIEKNKKIEQNKENNAKKNAKKKMTFTPTIEDSDVIAAAPSVASESLAECLDKQALSEPTVEHASSPIVYAISDITAPDVEAAASGQLSEILVKSTAEATTNTTELEAIKQQIISELQGQIEKFLQESLSFMQDDVNKWLTEEVSRQLEQQLKSHVM